MAHLGDDVSALVDGQLPPERAEEALAHLVTCEACAAQVAVERASRRRLSEAHDVAPSAELTDRLLRLGAAPAAPWPAPGGLRAHLRTGSRRRLVVRASLAVAGAAGVAGALVVVGALTERTGDPAGMLAQVSGPGQGPSTFVVSADSVQRVDAGADTTTAALAWLRDHDWPAPADLPEGIRISHVGTSTDDAGREVVEVAVVADGRPVQVLQQRGVLDVAALATLPTVPLGSGSAFRLPGAGAGLVAQCDDVVVLVTAAGEDAEHVTQVAELFPATNPGTGVAGRLDRGLDTVVGWTQALVG
ncbi:zf-HC2 domain-containing protein [Georgenia sp. TF02-10]|uniref:anti-sigma factor family protein n=1 Tax=Georgenia sp. TF02-10 TaxID=2917725 RepID=UPI001FA7ECFD|nr:zf-HC2 domain-containing protein [Georgenia sp. TF02-10]UNX56446.1 zf-HC2 domain-containing protein [Georgenia sp. TF02-10]